MLYKDAYGPGKSKFAGLNALFKKLYYLAEIDVIARLDG